MFVAIRLASSRVSRLAAVRRPGFFHRGGHSCSTRVRCRIVSLMRGRCLMVVTKISRALSRFGENAPRYILSESIIAAPSAASCR